MGVAKMTTPYQILKNSNLVTERDRLRSAARPRESSRLNLSSLKTHGTWYMVLMAWSECKERGNRLYQSKDFQGAVEAYTLAIKKCNKEEDEVVLLKNRAAAYLKLQSFKLALSDCDAALHICPQDIKSLYRRSQALEAIGDLSEAFSTIKTLLSLEPNNKEACSAARRLVEAIKRRSDLQQSTSTKVQDMFAALERGTDKDVKIRAAKNFAILSRDSSGYRDLLAEKGVLRLVSLLNNQPDQVLHHILQTLAGLCGGRLDVAVNVVKAVSLDRLVVAVKSPSSLVSNSAVALLKTVAVTLSNAALSSPTEKLLLSVIQLILALLLMSDVSASSRDAVTEAITTTLEQVRYKS